MVNVAKQANDALEASNAPEALRQATRALASGLLDKPNQAVTLNIRGAASMHLGDYQSAIADFSQAIGLAPNYPEAYNNRGSAFFSMGELSAAQADFDKAIKLRPDYDLARYNRARMSMAQGKVPAAIKDLSLVIAIAPNNPLALYQRGRAWFLLEDYKRAEEDLKGSLAQAQTVEPLLALGDIRLRQGAPKEALAFFSQASELDPEAAAPQFNMGIAYERLQDNSRAEVAYGAAIRLNPSLADAYNNRGALRALKGNRTGAMKDYDQAIALEPKHAPAYLNRAKAMMAAGRDNMALTDLSRALSLAPTLPGAQAMRARLTFRNNDFKAANQAYNAALKQTPEDRQLRLERAQARLLANNLHGSTVDCTTLIKAKETPPKLRLQALKLRGRVHFINRLFPKAAEDLKTYTEEGGESVLAQVWERLARLRAGESPAQAATCQDQWPCPLLGYMNGSLTEQALLGAAGDDQGQQCEALFVMGQHDLLKGKRVQAVRRFKAVLATGKRMFSEYIAAGQELKRLGF